MAEPVKPDERSFGFGTRALHADDVVAVREAGIAPSIGVSTTFRRPEPDSLSSPFDLGELGESNPAWHVYSRYTTPNLTRVEAVLSNLLGGCALTFGSGLAAIHAALIHFTPPAIAITAGYAGSHATIELYSRGREVKLIGLDDDYPPGTLCWLETPVNPYGEVRDIARYAAKAHAAGGKLVVDSTFAPPPLQDPLAHGADMVMHSATKYLAGHSDVLMGVLVVRTAEEWQRLIDVRKFGGAVPGSLEAWLLLRSLRTLQVRVERQARTATDLARWLDAIARAGEAGHDGVEGGVLARCHHAALQPPLGQLSYGPATFAIVLESQEQATRLPHALRLFAPATSLGGVESLIEQRLQTDSKADPRLIRLSIGLEDLEDLKHDLRDGLNAVRSGTANGSSQS